MLAALVHSTPAAGVSQTLRSDIRNGIMELSQRAPLVFGCAAITLVIGPHSSFVCFLIYATLKVVNGKPSIILSVLYFLE